MIPNTRYCIVFKHEEIPCSYICTHKDCNFDNRWVCVECIKNNTHQHGQKTQSHLLGQNDFKSYFKQIDFKQIDFKYLSEQEIKINKCLRALHKIIEQVNQLDCYLQLCLKESCNKIFRDMRYLIDHQFFLINNQQICQIVKLNQNPNLTFDQNKFDESTNQIILLSQQLQQVNVKQQQMVEYQNQLNQQPQQNQKITDIQQQEIRLNEIDLQVLEDQLDQQVQKFQQVEQKVQQVQQQQVYQYPLSAQDDKKQQHSLTYEVFKKFQWNYINDAQISQNEKYLAHGGSDKRIIIYNLQSQITKEMKFDNIISTCCLVEIPFYYISDVLKDIFIEFNLRPICVTDINYNFIMMTYWNLLIRKRLSNLRLKEKYHYI